MPPLHPCPVDCDGLITDQPGVPLCIFTADCVPVLFHEPEAGIAAAAHSGWKGTVHDMMGAAVRAVEALGGSADKLRAAIGPSISRCCFEVGGEVIDALDRYLGGDSAGLYSASEEREGKYFLDLKAANARRLRQLGVPAEAIAVSDDCTFCLPDKYWSHRFTKGRRGAQGALIAL